MIKQDMSNFEYHKADGISSSNLKDILKSPALYKYNKENEMEPNDGIKLGTAIHTWFLEPELFDDTYVENQKNSKGRIITDLQTSNEVDYPRLTPANFDKFDAMRDALSVCPVAQQLKDNAALIEASFFIEQGDRTFKCRPDLITKDGWIVDLKTVGGMKDSPSMPENFCRNFFDYNYDLQMFMYKRIVEAVTGKKFKGFKFLCVDAKKPISGTKCYTFFDQPDNRSKHFEIGGIKFNKALELLDKCEQSGEFYVYKNVHEEDMMLSYQAEQYLTEYGEE